MGVRQAHHDPRQTSNSQRPQPNPSSCLEPVGGRHGRAGRAKAASGKRTHPTGPGDTERIIDDARRSSPWQRSLSSLMEPVKDRPWHMLVSSLHPRSTLNACSKARLRRPSGASGVVVVAEREMRCCPCYRKFWYKTSRSPRPIFVLCLLAIHRQHQSQ
ncbi:hypothetical protein CGRA01v4_05665 [Colletotrichum graminicola]|nr:hypothetical protein CGRA01v4_05665 [Colletotrichum graminicola]